MISTVILTAMMNQKLLIRCNKFLQLNFAGVLDIYQRVLFKKFHNGHFFNSLPLYIPG